MEVMMKKKVLIILGIAAVLVTMFIIGAVAGGGMIYTWLHQVQSASAAQATEPDPEAGLIVTSVEEDGPADKAGIVRGDILQKINGHDVNSMVDVWDALEELEAGDDVRLTFLHGDQLRSANVQTAEDLSGFKLGFSLCCGKGTPFVIEATEMGDGKPLIVRVQEDSPAEAAGLETGDLILSIDGEEINAEQSLSEWISQYEPGDQIRLEIRNLRDEESRDILVELGEHPDEEGKAYLGVQVIQAPNVLNLFGEGHPIFEFNFPPTDEENFPFHILPRDRWERPSIESGLERGIIIVEVIENSPASKAGLEEGDVITALDGEDIEGLKSFADNISAMQPGKKVALTIYRASSDETLELQVPLGEHPEDPKAGYLGVHIRGIHQLSNFDEKNRFERWFPFLDQFRFPFDFERIFQNPGLEDA
jgi:S1-C subfamily serine protease